MFQILLTYVEIIAGGLKETRETQEGTHQKKKKMSMLTENMPHIPVKIK